MSLQPRGAGLFYGWVVVGALSVAGGISVAMGIGNFGVFVEPMSEELGTGRSVFGWALTARLIGFSLSGPLIGRMLDRYGARIPFAVAGLTFGLSAIGLGFVSAGWQMVGLTFFGGVLGFWGSTTLYLTVPVAKWFIRKRGRAMSIVFAGVPLGIAISAPVSQALIDAFGWRTAWVLLGSVSGVAVAGLSLVLVRSTPESIGLHPDGVAPSPHRVGGATLDEHPWTARDAIRTGAFWRMAIAFGVLMGGMGTLGLFWVPYATRLGFTASTAAFAFSTQAFSQVAVSAVLSQVLDRIQPRYVASGGFVSLMAGLLVAINASATWHLFAGSALAGIGIGSAMLLQAHIWPQYFGRRHIGAVRGMASPISLGLSAVGSAGTGMIFDATGSYVPAWWTIIGALAVGVVLLSSSAKPVPKTRQVQQAQP